MSDQWEIVGGKGKKNKNQLQNNTGNNNSKKSNAAGKKNIETNFPKLEEVCKFFLFQYNYRFRLIKYVWSICV